MNWARITFLVLRIVGWVGLLLILLSRWRVRFEATNLLLLLSHSQRRWSAYASSLLLVQILGIVVLASPSNQTMKPTAPFRKNFSVFATTPSTSSRLPASLVRFASSRSRTPAVLLFNDCRGLSLSR